MKNYPSTLFSQMVSTIETIIETGEVGDCGTYEQLATALNERGFTNSRGKQFSGSNLQRYLHRIRHPEGYCRVLTNEFMELYDEYYPAWIDRQNWSWDKKVRLYHFS